jgi:predicted AAA+ superfamily ATPase
MEPLYLPRKAEGDVLKRLEIFPAVVLVGPRQVGKTSLTAAIRNQIGRPSLYLDLERIVDLAKLDDLEGLAERNLDKLIILDEIQRYPALFPELRSIIDRKRTPGRFLLLGSASPQLIRDSSESLAGRVAYLELGGLQLSEILPTQDYRTHWFRGGFPDSLLAQDNESSSLWREAFISSYLERELPLLGLRVSPTTIRRLWIMLAHTTGQVANASKLAASLELSSPTLKRYIDFLEQAYLVRRLSPYYANVKKRLVKSPKLYLRDSGILHELLGIPSYEGLLSHPTVGSSWETYIVEQISNLLPRGNELFYYRTQDGAEIDLVIVRGGRVQSVIEIKRNQRPRLTKGFYLAADDLSVDRRFIIAPVEGKQRTRSGEWLLGPDALTEVFN